MKKKEEKEMHGDATRRDVLRGALALGATGAFPWLAGCAGDEGGAEIKPGAGEGTGTQPWNIVLFYTDDQRADTLWAMPVLQQELVGKGVFFRNAFITTPVCGPSRASLLSGGFYPFNTQILTNNPPNGGAALFTDRESLAVMLQRRGYATAILGKYLNGYGEIQPYIPPGWTEFLATGRGDWNDFEVVRGSSTPDAPGQGTVSRQSGEYLTYYLRDRALEFVRARSNGPFFACISTAAPHSPATPAKGDESAFQDYVYSSPNLNETDLSDKPQYVRDQAHRCKADAEDENCDGEFFRNQLRSLLAVDRSIGTILETLRDLGVLDRTLVIYASDNGFMWGEHGLFAKSKPYEESIRVPLIVRMPGVAPRSDDHLIAVNLDVGATVLRAAGVDRPTDGQDLIPLLGDPATPWRDSLVLQIYGGAERQPPWVGVRTQDWKYVEYITGERELYDLVVDPYELESRHGEAGLIDLMERLAALMAPWVGLTVMTESLPDGTAGAQYEAALAARGGAPPYSWSLAGGALPDGLLLDPEGVIRGIPERTGRWEFNLETQDSSVSPQSGRPQTFVARKLSIRIRS